MASRPGLAHLALGVDAGLDETARVVVTIAGCERMKSCGTGGCAPELCRGLCPGALPGSARTRRGK